MASGSGFKQFFGGIQEPILDGTEVKEFFAHGFDPDIPFGPGDPAHEGFGFGGKTGGTGILHVDPVTRQPVYDPRSEPTFFGPGSGGGNGFSGAGAGQASIIDALKRLQALQDFFGGNLQDVFGQFQGVLGEGFDTSGALLDAPDVSQAFGVEQLLSLVDSPIDIGQFQGAISAEAHATADELFRPGGAVESRVGDALRESVRGGFGTTSGGVDFARQNILTGARDSLARSIAANSLEAAGLAVGARGQQLSALSTLAGVGVGAQASIFASRQRAATDILGATLQDRLGRLSALTSTLGQFATGAAGTAGDIANIGFGQESLGFAREQFQFQKDAFETAIALAAQGDCSFLESLLGAGGAGLLTGAITGNPLVGIGAGIASLFGGGGC